MNLLISFFKNSSFKIEQCLFIPDKGPCRGNHERWYFDTKIGMCKTFSYGGCIKNKNNHLSEVDCIDSCVKPKQKAVCIMPKIGTELRNIFF